MRKIPSDIVAEIEHAIGGVDEISLLHRPWIRGRESFRPENKQSPCVYLLKTKSGAYFKLLLAAENSQRLNRIIHYLGRCEHLPFFPSLAANGKNWAVVDYVLGTKPKFSSNTFAYGLGQAMAGLHSIDQRPCNAKEITKHFYSDVEQLQASSLLTDKRELKSLYSVISTLDLQNYSTSLDYYDIKPSNFIYGAEEKIFFIDLGAIGENRPTGQYLFGSFHYHSLDNLSLFKGYLDGGGSSEVLDKEIPLRILHSVWLAAHYYRRASEVPLYAAPIKYGFQMIARKLIREGTELALGFN